MGHLKSRWEEKLTKIFGRNIRSTFLSLAMFTTMNDHALFMKITVSVKKSHTIRVLSMQQSMSLQVAEEVIFLTIPLYKLLGASLKIKILVLCASTLPAEIQRLLSTMRELDDRSNMMLNQNRELTRQCLSLPSQSLKKATPEQEETIGKLRKEIEANQENILNLSTEKVLLAKQAQDLLESHIKRLDEDLLQFAEDLKQEGKIASDEPAILPLLSSREERRRSYFFPPQARKLESKAERDWEKDRDRDFELMPPPGSHRRTIPAPVDVDQPIDPNEPTYCVCHQVSFGDMIACDNENCEGGEWFHYACVGLTSETRFKGKWYCPTCRMLPRKGASDPSV